MKQFLLSVFVLFAVQNFYAQGFQTHLSKVGNGYSQSSVNTAIFRASSVLTADSAGVLLQYVSYYSAEGKLTLARRVHGSDKWTTNVIDHRGCVEDGHNVISMGVDRNGFLHVCYDHHGSCLHYRRSQRPYSIELTDEISMVGSDEEEITYPEFHSLSSGNLLFVYRTGRSGNGNMIMNSYDYRSDRWTRVHSNLIDGEGQRNAYWQMTADNRGRIHLSWVWRETWMVETNHDLCYAYSDDEGRSWHRSDGSVYKIPIVMDDAEVAWPVDQKSELINQTGMAADKEGNPYIATYWRAKNDSVPQYRVVWHDGMRWQMKVVGHRSQPFSLAGGGTKMIPIARPRMVIDGKEAIFIFRDAERGSRVSIHCTHDITKGEWRTADLTSFEVGAWEPSIDEEMWKDNRVLHIFVQYTLQGDGEKTVVHDPTMVSVLEVHK